MLLVTRSIVRESRAEAEERHFDALGAALITSSLVLLVYALTQANSNGWSSAKTIGVLAASAVLMVLFLVIEHRSKAPLIPLGDLRRLQTLTGANIVSFFLGALTFAMFFMLSLYMQQVLGLSALQTGVGYLAVALTAIVSAGVAQALVTKIGVKPALLLGLVMMASATSGSRRSRRTALRGRPPPRLLRDRDRARLLVRTGLDRRACRRHAATRRASRRALQHVAADRRRPRRRHPVDGRDEAQRRLVHSRRAHARVQHRVLGCGRRLPRG